MATIYDLKPGFQKLLRPCVDRLARSGVTPNQVTVAALVMSVLAGAAIALWPCSPWPLLALPVVLLARMALNAVDGMLAREHALTSPLGAILNEVGDVTADAALYLPLGLAPALDARLVVAAVVVAGLTELVGVTAATVGASRRYDGPMGKSDRAFWFSLVAVGVAAWPSGARWMNALVAGIAFGSAVTVVNRTRAALREIRG
jgi:CDP-diacylglycerol--glycerol-3-phosphate 3-phosphatidyltransferase